MTPEINPGDIVTLKSGSPKMTVESVYTNGALHFLQCRAPSICCTAYTNVRSRQSALMLWRGIFKLIEETAELTQVLGKLCVVPEGPHWDEQANNVNCEPAQKPLRERLTDEIADVYAALDYLVAQNTTPEERYSIAVRRCTKLARYQEWVLTGINA